MKITRDLFQSDKLKATLPLIESQGGTGFKSVAELKQAHGLIGNSEKATFAPILNASKKIPLNLLPEGYGPPAGGQVTELPKYDISYSLNCFIDAQIKLLVNGVENFGLPSTIEIYFDDVPQPVFIDTQWVDSTAGLHVFSGDSGIYSPRLTELIVYCYQECHCKIVFDTQIIEFDIQLGTLYPPDIQEDTPPNGTEQTKYFVSTKPIANGGYMADYQLLWEVSTTSDFSNIVATTTFYVDGYSTPFVFINNPYYYEPYLMNIAQAGVYYVRAKYLATRYNMTDWSPSPTESPWSTTLEINIQV